MQKFEAIGTVADDNESCTGRPRSARTEENVELARQLFDEEPSTSTTKAAQELGVSQPTMHRIVRKDLNLFPYKIQVQQPLNLHSIDSRLQFANLKVELIESGEIDVMRIWFSDECHFHLSGYVNKQNWRHWGTQHPEVYVVKPLHPQRLTVWCAISGHGIIGPVFIDGNVDSSKYQKVLEEFIPKA